jgi:hypothetical protein
MSSDGPPLPLLPALPVITLLGGGTPMMPPEGLVYSTDPQSYVDTEGIKHVVKGPDVSVVVAEAIAYPLARYVGLEVPDYALGVIENTSEHYFACRKQENATRDVEPWLRRKAAGVLEQLSRIVVFDIWVANEDRNLGGLLGRRRSGGSEIDLIAIDFEKAQAIRGPHPLITTAQVAPGRLWPRELLGRLLGQPVAPTAMVRRVESVPVNVIEAAVGAAHEVLGEAFPWADSVVQGLTSRRNKIADLVREVWKK